MFRYSRASLGASFQASRPIYVKSDLAGPSGRCRRPRFPEKIRFSDFLIFFVKKSGKSKKSFFWIPGTKTSGTRAQAHTQVTKREIKNGKREKVTYRCTLSWVAEFFERGGGKGEEDEEEEEEEKERRW